MDSTAKALDLGIFIKRLLEEEMGHAIDLARMSDMQDRQFTQFEKSIKSHVRKTVDMNIRALSEVKNFTVDLSVLAKPENKENKQEHK